MPLWVLLCADNGSLCFFFVPLLTRTVKALILMLMSLAYRQIQNPTLR